MIAKRLKSGAGVGLIIVGVVGTEATTAGAVNAVWGPRTVLAPINITPGLAVTAVNAGEVKMMVALGPL